MKKTPAILTLSLAAALLPMSPAQAAEMQTSINILPVRYIDVEGDVEKYEAHHWMNAGYAGGIENFEGVITFEDGSTFTTEAHAIGGRDDSGDYGAEILYKKEGVGHIVFDFTQFRKYYDGTGGHYHPFPVLGTHELERKLFLDIGEIELGAQLNLEDWPILRFKYAREYKDGVKSRLTWGEAEETVGAGSRTRNITPSWFELDEIVDEFELGIEKTVGNLTFVGEQHWEFTRIETKRFERDISTTGGNGDDKLRFQELNPEITRLTSLLGAKGSFVEQRLQTGTAYRYGHLTSREFETLIETNAAGVPTNFSNAEQTRNARADNRYESHTWAQNASFKFSDDLKVAGKLTADLVTRDSSSTLPDYGDPNAAGGAVPDATVDSMEQGLTDNHARTIGEGISLRFTGLPRTALYTDLEFEQMRSLLREDQRDLIAGSQSFFRETITHTSRGEAKFGARVAPVRFLDVTAEYIKDKVNNDYDDRRDSDPDGASAWIDHQVIEADEFKTRVTLKPARWLRTSLRYSLVNQNIESRTEQTEDYVKTGTDTHIWTYDVSVQPLAELFTLFSFTRQTSTTFTPARYGNDAVNVAARIPAFTADVNTFMASVDYIPVPETAFNAAFEYSRAENFNDFTAIGLPYGVDAAWMNFALGVDQKVGENTTVGVEYEHSKYLANSLAEAGNYKANAVWVNVETAF